MTRSSISEAGQDPRLKASSNNNEAGIGGDTVAFNPLHPSMELPPERLNQFLNMGSEKTRNRTMTTPSQISEAAQEARPSTGGKKKTSAGRTAVAFNPLHPSMELPPEQLIRLLSMASKKTRKQMKERGLSGQSKPRPAPQGRKPPTSASSQVSTEEYSSARLSSEAEAGAQTEREAPRLDTQRKTPQAPAKAQKSRQAAAEKRTPDTTRRKKSRSATGEDKAAAKGDQQPSRARAAVNTTRRTKASTEPETHTLPSQHKRRRGGDAHYQAEKFPSFNKRGPGWLLLALVVGLVAGASLSAYLFWYQTSSAEHQKTASPPVPGEAGKPQSAKQASTKLVKRKPAPASDKARALPAQAPARAKAAGGATDARWQAATEKEQVRLHKAAEQRLAEKLTRMQVEQERANLQATPAYRAEPATAVKRPVVVPPAVEQVAVSAPEAGHTETSAAAQTGVELTGADDGQELAMEADPMPAPPPLQDVAPGKHDGTIAEAPVAEETPEEYSVQQIDPAVGASDVAAASDASTVADTQQSVSTNPVAADSEPVPLDSEPVELTATDNESEIEQSADGTAFESQASAAEDEDSF